ncbi:MAG TPA: DUF4259 domain-containing protein [Lysobacter sp.]|nr:DUF4259 domain-containing protein [Lysobacter sp.]
MGAWGTGVFEDDTALDFIDEQLLPSPDPHATMRAAFEAANAADYVDYEMGHAVLVSAAALRALRTGRPFEDDEDDDWADWRRAHAALDTTDLSRLAAQACRRVAAAGSELAELWAENDELYPEWKAGVESLASAVDG